MKIRTKIIRRARKWLDTPYHHDARLLGVGVDCAQLIIATALDSDIITEEDLKLVPKYSREWHIHNSEEKLKEVLLKFGCEEIDPMFCQPGDIMGFKYGRVMSHLGIMTPNERMIHARLDVGKVVETHYTDCINRFTNAFKFPGVI